MRFCVNIFSVGYFVRGVVEFQIRCYTDPMFARLLRERSLGASEILVSSPSQSPTLCNHNCLFSFRGSGPFYRTVDLRGIPLVCPSAVAISTSDVRGHEFPFVTCTRARALLPCSCKILHILRSRLRLIYVARVYTSLPLQQQSNTSLFQSNPIEFRANIP